MVVGSWLQTLFSHFLGVQWAGLVVFAYDVTEAGDPVLEDACPNHVVTPLPLEHLPIFVAILIFFMLNRLGHTLTRLFLRLLFSQLANELFTAAQRLV